MGIKKFFKDAFADTNLKNVIVTQEKIGLSWKTHKKQ